MGYANPFFAMGAQHFANAARDVGVDGIIVPDLPPEAELLAWAFDLEQATLARWAPELEPGTGRF